MISSSCRIFGRLGYIDGGNQRGLVLSNLRETCNLVDHGAAAGDDDGDDDDDDDYDNDFTLSSSLSPFPVSGLVQSCDPESVAPKISYGS